jgi:hypothetical protein
MKEIGQGIAGLGFVGVCLYGFYWVAKTVSYALFYESMVKDTVIEVLRSQGLVL